MEQAEMTGAGEQSKAKASRSQTGVVSSASGDKTIRVVVDMLVKHPRYGKYIRRRTKLAAHDERNQAALGDVVEIAPCRPISKAKSWRLLRVVRSTGLVD